MERYRDEEVDGEGTVLEIAGHFAGKGRGQTSDIFILELVDSFTGEVLETEWRAETVKKWFLARTVGTRLMSDGEPAPTAKRR
jgi:hypothetical protein